MKAHVRTSALLDQVNEERDTNPWKELALGDAWAFFLFK